MAVKTPRKAGLASPREAESSISRPAAPRAMGRRRKRRAAWPLLLVVLAGAAAAAWTYAQRAEPALPAPPPTPAGELRVHYVDVGQGDGIVWELPDGSVALYDCGPPPREGESPMVRYLRDELGLASGSRIAALVTSHGHLDHVGGCAAVLEAYAVEHVVEAWYEGADAPASYQRYLAAVEAEGALVHRLPQVQPGDALPVAGATLLWPRAFAPGGWDAIAQASLVVRLVHGATSFCFQGDIEQAQEGALDARCDVYLVGHHGSRHASSASWLARMEPRIAVASFGHNAYGHPHPEALCRIQQAGAEIFTTHRTGGVVVSSDGAEVRIVKGEPERADHCAPGASYWP